MKDMININRYKYRAKTMHGEWIYGVPIYLNHEYPRNPNSLYILDSDNAEFCYSLNGEASIHPDKWVKVDPATLGQCTGVKDVCDNLIYEGDIIDEVIGYKIYDYPFKVCVKYNNNTLRWEIWSSEKTSQGILKDTLQDIFIPFNGWQVKIFGNIHDNLELLLG